MANPNLRFALYQLPAEQACGGRGWPSACWQPKGDKRDSWAHRPHLCSASSVVVLNSPFPPSVVIARSAATWQSLVSHSERSLCHSERTLCHSERTLCHSERSRGIYSNSPLQAPHFEGTFCYSPLTAEGLSRITFSVGIVPMVRGRMSQRQSRQNQLWLTRAS